MVYFIQVNVGKLIKIGYTRNENSLINRIKYLQIHVRSELEVLATIPDVPIEFEKFLHRKFKNSQVIYEWFLPTKDILDLIESILKIQSSSKRAIQYTDLQKMVEKSIERINSDIKFGEINQIFKDGKRVM